MPRYNSKPKRKCDISALHQARKHPRNFTVNSCFNVGSETNDGLVTAVTPAIQPPERPFGRTQEELPAGNESLEQPANHPSVPPAHTVYAG